MSNIQEQLSRFGVTVGSDNSVSVNGRQVAWVFRGDHGYSVCDLHAEPRAYLGRVLDNVFGHVDGQLPETAALAWVQRRLVGE